MNRQNKRPADGQKGPVPAEVEPSDDEISDEDDTIITRIDGGEEAAGDDGDEDTDPNIGKEPPVSRRRAT